MFGPREVLLTSEEPVVKQFLNGRMDGPIGMSEEKDSAHDGRREGHVRGRRTTRAASKRSRAFRRRCSPRPACPSARASLRRQQRVLRPAAHPARGRPEVDQAGPRGRRGAPPEGRRDHTVAQRRAAGRGVAGRRPPASPTTRRPQTPRAVGVSSGWSRSHPSGECGRQDACSPCSSTSGGSRSSARSRCASSSSRPGSSRASPSSPRPWSRSRSARSSRCSWAACRRRSARSRSSARPACSRSCVKRARSCAPC